MLPERDFPANTSSWIFPHYSLNLCSAATMAFGTAQYSFQSTASDIYEPINWCCVLKQLRLLAGLVVSFDCKQVLTAFQVHSEWNLEKSSKTLNSFRHVYILISLGCLKYLLRKGQIRTCPHCPSPYMYPFLPASLTNSHRGFKWIFPRKPYFPALCFLISTLTGKEQRLKGTHFILAHLSVVCRLYNFINGLAAIYFTSIIIATTL